MALFQDRREAGVRLAERLSAYRGRDVLVLGLPRGGVPVAYEVARALEAPLDIYTVRKLGTPGQPELAMGAIASGGFRVMNDDVVQALGISPETIERVTARERKELERREAAYRGDRPRPTARGRTVILVDDGLATGASMHAAVRALRQQHPGKIVVAVPTAPPETCAAFEDEVDEIICVTTPEPFRGVGGAYADFEQTSDQTVQALLERARGRGKGDHDATWEAGT